MITFIDCSDPDYIFDEIVHKCYRLVADRELYVDAQLYICRDDGAKLAEPKSKEENDAIAAMAPTEDLWIGIQDMEIEGRYVYDSTDEPIGYENFPLGIAPTNQDQDCVAIQARTADWDDDLCFGVKHYSVCEMEPLCDPQD